LIVSPPLSGWVGGIAGATTVAPLALAALTLVVGWRFGLPVEARAAS